MAIADASGIPVAAHIESASPHEVKLVEATIDSGFTQYAPDKLIGDKAYDSDGLDQRLLDERNVEVIAPHRKGRKKRKTQDGRKLRRYRRRWKVERLFPGFKISGGLLLDTNIMPIISLVWYSLVAQ